MAESPVSTPSLLSAPSGSPPRVFLTSQWLNIAMANYEIDPRLLESHVPPGTELDLLDGKAWISVVGLLFVDTRVFGLGIPFHRNFEEINLRIYVRREVGGETRRAVTFIRELVPRRGVAWTARALYGEKYLATPMRHAIEPAAGGAFRGITYEWGRGASRCRLMAKVDGEPQALIPGSPEAFIAEHEWGYSRRRDGATFEYRVEHPPWRIWKTDRMRLEGDLAAWYGPELASVLKPVPDSAFVADGSAVRVYHGVRVPSAKGNSKPWRSSLP